ANAPPPPAPDPAPQCLGMTQDCSYGGTPQCCAPMACLCAHGYCRCGSSPPVDSDTGAGNNGSGASSPPPPPPSNQPCPPADCVSMVAKHPTGAGHCDGEVTGFITNN